MADFEYDRIAQNNIDFHSSAIEALAYNRNAKTLLVEFIHGGTYIYAGIEESTFNLAWPADSVGRFYREHIRGRPLHKAYLGCAEVDLVQREDDVIADNLHIQTSNEHRATHGFGDNVSGSGNQWVSASTAAVQRWSVKWDFIGGSTAGPFEPEVFAGSEAQAIDAVKRNLHSVFGDKDAVKILAVTHYFD